jgi:plasmid stabilization system protein ParE
MATSDSTSAAPSSTGRRGKGRPTATHFNFEHKIFQVEKAYFGLAGDGLRREPMFFVMLGDLNASIRLNSLRREFDITPESVDGQLLQIVEKGLAYVREIRHNDSIPSELLDGSASWTVEPRHRALARIRIGAHVMSLVEGEKTADIGSMPAEALDGDPDFKDSMQAAFAAVAETIGIGAERKQEVVDKIEEFSREYSYIEALRERATECKKIAAGIGQLLKLFKSDKTALPELVRVQALIRKPLEELERKFSTIDDRISDIAAVLRGFDEHVELVRCLRDELHYHLSLWDELIEKWSADRDGPEAAKRLIRETYRFAATNFPQTHQW